MMTDKLTQLTRFPVPRHQITAIELGPARSITEQMTGVKPLASPFEQFDAGGKRFSPIVMSQVLEHVLDVNLWAARDFDLLKPGGVLDAKPRHATA